MGVSDILEQIYKNPENSGSFGGVQPLYVQAKKLIPHIKFSDVKEWLSSQDTYTLHKQAYRKFKRNKIYVAGIDHQWELDLVDMQQHSIHNNGYKYMLTCIDSFSKYAWAIPIKDKGAKSVSQAFASILNSKRMPYRVRTDKGKEFVNSQFSNLLNNRGIEFFTSQNEDIKCAIVERFNRTLKSRMYRYFTENKTRKWIDIVDNLVSSYNKSRHRSIKTAPINVTLENESNIRAVLYGTESAKQPKLQAGDYVRITIHRQPFDKGYLPQWSEEIFKIYKVLQRTIEPLYKIRDLKEEDIYGTFYEKEIQKIHWDKNKVFSIESIIAKRKGPRGEIQLLVKWKGYPEKFNEWINEKDLK
jgi:Integrase core domain/Chromo (CHRromatin Organisation MOdifier) domain